MLREVCFAPLGESKRNIFSPFFTKSYEFFWHFINFPLPSFVTYKYNLNEQQIHNFNIVEGNSKSRSTDDRSVDEIASAIRQPVTLNMPSLIPPPQTDKAAAIANLIAIQLREVHQPQLLDKLTLKLLQTINDAKEGNLN